MEHFTLQDMREEARVAHPSTQGALVALDALAGQGIAPSSLIDIGCASGILSLYAARLWPACRVLATDISQQAMVDTQANARACGLWGQVRCMRTSSAADPALIAAEPSLVVANVLATYHVANAAAYARLLFPAGGWLIVSGIRLWESATVLAALAAVGFLELAEFRQAPWATFLVAYPARTSASCNNGPPPS